MAGDIAAVLAVIVVTGSLSSLIMFQARGEMKAAQEGYWWRSWGKIDPKYDSPVISMLWQSGFALILVWASSIQDLLSLFTFICLLRNALLFCAWFPLQKKANYHPTFKAPGGPVMAVLAIVPSLILMSDSLWPYLRRDPAVQLQPDHGRHPHRRLRCTVLLPLEEGQR